MEPIRKIIDFTLAYIDLEPIIMGVETLAYIAIIAAAGVGAYSSIQAANASERVGRLNSQADQTNAIVSKQQGDAEAVSIRDRNKRIQAAQRVGFLKSGITLSGSALDVMYDSSLEGELDALNAQYKGQIGYYSNMSKSQIDSEEASSRATAYRYQAAGSILSGTGDALSLSNSPTFKTKNG